MTAWDRVLYRVLACGCWWAALCLFVAAFRQDVEACVLGDLALFVAGCLLVGVGVGLWRGER